MVVFLHSYSKALSQSMSGSTTWWVQDLVSQGISRAAVPFFFAVFGFFLFGNYDEVGVFKWWQRQVSRRLRSLVIPYFVWSLIGLLSTFALTRFATTQIFSFNWTSLTWWLEVLGVSTFPKFMFHLWFVKAIFIFTLFSPIIAAIAFRMPLLTVLTLFIFSVFRFVPFGDWPSNLMFVVIGMIAASKSTGYTKRKCNFAYSTVTALGGIWICLVFIKVWLTKLGVVDIYGTIPLTNMFEMNIMVLINMLGVAALWFCYDVWAMFDAHFADTVFNHISVFAFFVYCSHWVIMPWIGSVVRQTMFRHYQLMTWMLPPILTIVFAILLGSLMRRRIPTVYALLTGGRV